MERNVANVVDQLQNHARPGTSATKDVREQGKIVSCSPWSRAEKKVTSKGDIINSVRYGRPPLQIQ